MFSSISTLTSFYKFTDQAITLPPTTFIYTPFVFNEMIVFATNQTISPTTCIINGATYTITSENETLNGTALKWGYINFKSDNNFSINTLYSVYITFNNNTAYAGSLNDDVLNSFICMDETTLTASTKVWTSKVGSYSITLSTASSKVTSTANANNTSLAFQNAQLSGANIILTQQQNGTVGASWSYFCVARNQSSSGHLFANDTVTTTSPNFYILGPWNGYYSNPWWYNGWTGNAVTNATYCTNWNVYSFFKDTSNSNNATYYVNRNDTNTINTSRVTTYPNWPNYNIGHDIQKVNNAINGYATNVAFICLYKANKTNEQARCIEYCLFKQYGLISRY